MIIKSNASPDEKKSPFYIKNELFCSEFEQFIATKKGKVKGKYNAWSYTIFGKVSNIQKWNLMYKKATLSSNNILLSSKYQSLLVLAEWSTERKGTHNTEFLIRSKKKTDFLKTLFYKSSSKLATYDNYIIESNNKNSKFISKLIVILEPLFNSRELYKITHRNEELKIELRTEKHHFDIFDKLTQL